MYQKIIRVILVSIFWATLVQGGEEVEITSRYFESDDAKKTSVFTQDVVITKGLDKLTADRAVVTTDGAGKAEKFEFFGNPVVFTIKMDINQTYHGKALRIEYYPKTRTYHLYQAAYIEQVEQKRKVFGEEIHIDQEHKRARVIGSKEAPARFVFPADDARSSKESTKR
ncbi:MAG: lipopolysaccharide transport periplasmic protein LptA [Campylobacterales bacterium]